MAEILIKNVTKSLKEKSMVWDKDIFTHSDNDKTNKQKDPFKHISYTNKQNGNGCINLFTKVFY